MWIVATSCVAAAFADVQMPCQVSQIARDASNTLWFICNGSVARLNPSGSIDHFAAGSTFVQALAFDSDGTLWVASDGLYRLDANGTATQVTFPNVVVNTPAIAADRFGNIVVFGYANGTPEFPRITHGVLTAGWPVPNVNTPMDFAIGSDGTLWFAQFAPYTVGRVTMSGAVNSFAVPRNSGTLHMVAGPDGNLWASSIDHGALYRITPSGTVTSFAVPAVALAASSNRVWFTTDNGYGWIDVNTLDVQQFNRTTGPLYSRPAIVVMPAGDVWLAENFVPVGSPCPPSDPLPGQPPPPPCVVQPPPPDFRLVQVTAGGLVVAAPLFSPAALALLAVAVVAIALQRLMWR